MKTGFTLIELVLVMGITALLFTIGSISFFASHKSATIEATTQVLIADLRSQQSRAMSGEGYAGAQVEGWGLRIDPDRYTLLPTNTVVLASEGITFSSTFPSGGEIIFTRGSGDILNFVQGQDTITITSLGTSKVLRFNQYGISVGD